MVTTSQTGTMSAALGWNVRPSSFSTLRQAVPIGVVEIDVERLQPAKHREADPSGRDSADMHSLDVVGPGDAVGDVPATLHHPLVRGKIVPDEGQDHHDHMLGDADR